MKVDSEDQVNDPSRKSRVLKMLPEAPEGKITSKKMQRLEKFIEKQLKKDERLELLQKLGQNQFSSDLIRSSKLLGRRKLTAREKMRQSLLEEKSGVPQTIPDSRLYEEYDLEDMEEEDEVDEQEDELTTVKETVQAVTPDSKPVVLPNNRPPPEVVVDPSVPASAFIPPGVPPNMTFGSALKRKLPDKVADPEKSKKKKKSNKKKAANEKQEDSSSESSEEDEEVYGNLKIEPSPPISKNTKNSWTLDIEQGEKFATTSTPAVKKHPPEPVVKKPSEPVEKAYFVHVERPESIEAVRMKLPVVTEEQRIMDAIAHNDIVILCGETGSGKTTQVPQFLFEAGFGDPNHPHYSGMVGVTQPRRVAAVSMANRVSTEMNKFDGEVAYQIRYDAKGVSEKTRIKFMTDGILLRELSGYVQSAKENRKEGEKVLDGMDLLLPQYSAIIIDEAHERTVGTDVLIGWLTRVVRLRNSLVKTQNEKQKKKKLTDGAESKAEKQLGPLKLIIMSATLRVEDFTENKSLFPASVPKPPVLKIDGRQFKVTIHYNRVTPEIHYLGEVLKKVSKIHTRFPPGGILVFLTGQQEIQTMVRKLQAMYPQKKKREVEDEKETEESTGQDFFDEAENGGIGDDGVVDFADDFQDEEDTDDEEEEVEILDGEEGDPEDVNVEDQNREVTPLYVLPLYSMLPTSAQLRVFDHPPPGTRLCVVATNVAETSLTIPGIKYVVDSGKVKERKHDLKSGVQTYSTGWTSRASADQRAGRAGRVAPGHCYRLFSSAVYNDQFDQFSRPEILRVPISGVVLQMKDMGINQVVNFPFPTPPGKVNLMTAEKQLMHLGALEGDDQHRITVLGKMMAKFPVPPRQAKMLIVAAQQQLHVLPYVVAMVAAIVTGDPFLTEEQVQTSKDNGKESESDDEDNEEEKDEKAERRKERSSFFKIMQNFAGDSPVSDPIRLLRAVGAYAAECARKSRFGVFDAEEFCTKHYLRSKAMEEIAKLRVQLTNALKTTLTDSQTNVMSSDEMQKHVKELCIDPNLRPPNSKEIAVIRQIFLSCYADNVARYNEGAISANANFKQNRGKDLVPLYDTLWSSPNESFTIHRSSCVFRMRPPPKWIVYEEIVGKEERLAIEKGAGLVNVRGERIETGEDGRVVPVIKNPNEPQRYLLKGVTVVDESWIAPLAPKTLVSDPQNSKILEQPAPKYDPVKDTVVAFISPTFGPKFWDLPVREIDRGVRGRHRWFAQALFEGKVPLAVGKKSSKPNLNESNMFTLLTPYLSTKSQLLTKLYSTQLNPKVTGVVEALVKSDVDSKMKLLETWVKSPEFLKKEYLAWLPAEFHDVVGKFWPPVVVDAENKKSGIKIISSKLKPGLQESLPKISGKKSSGASKSGDGSDYDSDF
ncbi:hypothetical protein HK098_007351 [Nowakowskiella sp. JEL0407]|nr:hypothetical protein HK098_007351 [Nowakowskiella sp. JEL0407]